jgi:hypothetical protein
MSKKEKLIETWRPKISRAALTALAEGDKTPTTKYLEYMYKLWEKTRKQGRKPSSTKQLIQYVNKFDQLLPYIQNKDIYQYDTWLKLSGAVDNAQDLKDEKEFKREDHVQVLIENDDYLLLRPITHKGSLKYGANTKWCTASKNNESTFTSYTRGGYLFYLIRKKPKNNEWDKLAFYIQSLSGSGVLFNPVQTFCAKDFNHNTHTLNNSDWDLVTLATIHYYVRYFSITLHKKKVASDKIKSISRYLQNLDMEEIRRLMSELNVPNEESSQTLTQLAQTIESLNEKLKL